MLELTMTRKWLMVMMLRAQFGKSARASVQGDHSACSKPPVVFDLKVAF